MHTKGMNKLIDLRFLNICMLIILLITMFTFFTIIHIILKDSFDGSDSISKTIMLGGEALSVVAFLGFFCNILILHRIVKKKQL